jgi:cardiolipin-specific phospholipase
MDPEGGVRSVENLKKAGNHRSQTTIIPRAGHHRVFLSSFPNHS